MLISFKNFTKIIRMTKYQNFNRETKGGSGGGSWRRKAHHC
jgi:hypothetical protein